MRRLKPGSSSPNGRYFLDADTVAAYVEAVGDTSRPWAQDGAVPPMAVAALGLRGVIEDLSIPGGTVHAGQELQFGGAVEVGETLSCKATVAQNSCPRCGARFVAVALVVHDGRGREVMIGCEAHWSFRQNRPRHRGLSG